MPPEGKPPREPPWPAQDAPTNPGRRFDQPFRKKPGQTQPGGLQLRPIPDPTLPSPPPRIPDDEPPAAPVDVVFEDEPDTGVRSQRSLDKRHAELVEQNAKLEHELATRRQFDAAQQAVKDAQERRELADAPKTLRVQYGGFRIGVPAVIVLGIVGVLVKAYMRHQDEPPAQPADCVTKADYDRDMKTLDRRLSPLETYYQLQLITRTPAPAASR